MSVAVEVTEASQAGEARRIAISEAKRAGMSADQTARLAIVVTEMATNLFKHVPAGGAVLIETIGTGDAVAVELLAVDRGAGIRDLALSRRDGISTTGTPGTGLGAIARLSDEFDIYSQPNLGTAVMSRFRKSARVTARALDVAAISVAFPGEPVCGDAYAYTQHGNQQHFLVADGLGHGEGAHEAAARAKEVFLHNSAAPLELIFEKMHGALRPTRGAAAAIAVVDRARRAVRFMGVGNISGVLVRADGTRTSLVSQSGTIGHIMPHATEFSYNWPGADALLIMHSDGITSRWNLERYRGLLRRDPLLIAGVLYRDALRGRDDATILVAADREGA